MRKFKKGDLHCAITRDDSADFKVISGVEAERLLQTISVASSANFRFELPSLEPVNALQGVRVKTSWIDRTRQGHCYHRFCGSGTSGQLQNSTGKTENGNGKRKTEMGKRKWEMGKWEKMGNGKWEWEMGNGNGKNGSQRRIHNRRLHRDGVDYGVYQTF